MNWNQPKPPKKIDIEVTNVFRRIQHAKAKYVSNKGGAGSGKTYSICQFLIFRRLLLQREWKGLVLRKIQRSLKLSTYKTFFSILDDAGAYNPKCHNKTDLTYSVPVHKNFIQFSGLDNREKVKSTEWHDIFLEEANEFTKDDFTFLKTRLYRGQMKNGCRPRIWLAYNPVKCWIQDLENGPEWEKIHSTYRDNPFCNDEYAKTLESIKDENFAYYKIYALGEDAEQSGLIYPEWQMETQFPAEMDEVIYGVDFGFNAPSAVIEIGLKNKESYWKELLYRKTLTTPELILEMQLIIPTEKRNRKFYCDSENPDAIKQLKTAGFNAVPAKKEKNSVKAGIDKVKETKPHTLPENVNVNKERSMYSWAIDKNGNSKDEPVKAFDHALDAGRYAIYTHLGKPDILVWSAKG